MRAWALSAGSYDDAARLWDVATGHCLRTLQGDLNGASVSADGRLALSRGADRTLCLWEIATERCWYEPSRCPLTG
jgi:WD40 repeat protein